MCTSEGSHRSGINSVWQLNEAESLAIALTGEKSLLPLGRTFLCQPRRLHPRSGGKDLVKSEDIAGQVKEHSTLTFSSCKLI